MTDEAAWGDDMVDLDRHDPNDKGHMANMLDQLTRDRDAARASFNRLNEWAERATAALCRVRPLGGSELFTRVQGQSLADPEYCGEAIEQMHRDLHKARCEIAQLRKAAALSQDQHGG